MPSAFLQQAQSFASAGNRTDLAALIDAEIEAKRCGQVQTTAAEINLAIDIERSLEDRKAS